MPHYHAFLTDESDLSDTTASTHFAQFNHEACQLIPVQKLDIYGTNISPSLDRDGSTRGGTPFRVTPNRISPKISPRRGDGRVSAQELQAASSHAGLLAEVTLMRREKPGTPRMLRCLFVIWPAAHRASVDTARKRSPPRDLKGLCPSRIRCCLFLSRSRTPSPRACALTTRGQGVYNAPMGTPLAAALAWLPEWYERPNRPMAAATAKVPRSTMWSRHRPFALR